MGSFLFTNPGSGSYARKRIATALNFLHVHGIMPTVYTVRTPAEAQACCNAMYTITDQPLVIIAAGDGTINAVINGLLPGSATLAILPLGTSNVLAAELGICSLADGLARIISGTPRELCLGRLQMEHAGYRFALMAGIGFDGAVVRDLRAGEKRLLRQGGYLLSALRNCLTWETARLDVRTPAQQLNCHTAVVCNASRYGGNFVMAPETDVFTPGLAVACLTGRQRRSYLAAAFDLLRGSAGASNHIQRICADQVTVTGAKPIQIDGDFVGYGPAELMNETGVCRVMA